MYVYIYIYIKSPCRLSRNIMGPYFTDIKRRGMTPPTGPSIKWKPMTSRKRVHLCKVVSFSRQFWHTIVFRRVILHLRQLSCCPVHFCARKRRALSLFRTHPQAHHLNSRRSLSILDATRGYPGVVRVVATSNPGKLGAPI
jgi:hypothetical protein